MVLQASKETASPHVATEQCLIPSQVSPEAKHKADTQAIIDQLSDQPLQFLSIPERLRQIRLMAAYAVGQLEFYQQPNGIVEASLGRYDDETFKDKAWWRDHFLAIMPSLDPAVGLYLPEHKQVLDKIYISGARGAVKFISQPGSIERFNERPFKANGQGYATIDSRIAPFVKVDKSGNPIEQWGHNQPNTWAYFCLMIGRGIEKGYPVLEEVEEETMPAGLVFAIVADYQRNLNIGRFEAINVWEQGVAWSSYSERTAVLQGEVEVAKPRVWEALEKDSKKRGYELPFTRKQQQEAIRRDAALRTEHFPADKTHIHHPGAADAASAFILQEFNLPRNERRAIQQNLGRLRNGLGYYRFEGDTWKEGSTEAEWNLPSEQMAGCYFSEAKLTFRLGQIREGMRYIGAGLDNLNRIKDQLRKNGYVAELMEDEDQDGTYKINNNELAMGLAALLRSCGMGIGVTKISQQYLAA